VAFRVVQPDEVEWTKRPHEPGEAPRPVMIMISGLDSAKEELRSTEELFLERGIATFSVDGPGQGEAEYDLAIRGDWEVPGGAIIDYLQTEPGIDPGRIGVSGVSLGGYYAPRVASGDDRVKACIALAGPYDFADNWDNLPILTREAFRVRSKSPDMETARARAGELSMAGRAGRISCPLLAVMGRLDRLIPWLHAQRLVDEAGGPAELLLLEKGNHGCANLAPFHRYAAADWAAHHATAAAPATTTPHPGATAPRVRDAGCLCEPGPRGIVSPQDNVAAILAPEPGQRGPPAARADDR